MKKIIALLLAVCMVAAFAGCAKTDTATTTAAPETTEAAAESTEVTEAPTAPQEAEGDVMTHAEYIAAPVDSPVCIETYVQAHQSWWDNKVTVYAQSEDGAYFLYNMECSEEDAAKLTEGTKIRVNGFKTEWSGEVEIAEGATFEIEDGSYIAEATDVTDLLGTDDLINYQNQFVSFKGMTVEESEGGAAFLYNWDGSGSADSNSDLYFNVSLNGQTYTFTVESYLCDNTTDVYKTVEGLKVGDVIDMEGFLYWYNGVNPHITNVTVK